MCQVMGDETKESGLTSMDRLQLLFVFIVDVSFVSPSCQNKGEDEAFQSDVQHELQEETANAFQPSLHRIYLLSLEL